MTHNNPDDYGKAASFGLASACDTLRAVADKHPKTSVEYAKIMLAIKGLFFIAAKEQGAAFNEYLRDWGKKKPLSPEQHKRLWSFGLKCSCC